MNAKAETRVAECAIIAASASALAAEAAENAWIIRNGIEL